MRKTFNFSAGPAILPKSVLQETADEMLGYKDSGMSVMEISHRSALFQSIINETETTLRTLINIPNDHEALFLQGDTSLQLATIPMNSMRNRKADYIVTGYQARKAYQEVELYGEIHMAASSEDDNFSHIPGRSDLSISPNPDYAYMCENNMIYGIKLHKGPDSKEKILINDISSYFLSKPMSVFDYDMLFGGIQKNLGPAGLVIVTIREDLISEIVLPGIPTMLRYKTHADKGSVHNTPPTYNVYIVGKMIKWIRSLGSLDKMRKINESKAALLYNYLDKSDTFCELAGRDSCSLMNATFRTGLEALDSAFIEAAGENDITSVRGHRAIGGICTNPYNVMPIEGVQHLVRLMEVPEKSEGRYR